MTLIPRLFGSRTDSLLIFLLTVTFLACGNSMTTDPDLDQTPTDSLAILKSAFDDATECQTCHPNHYAEWQTSMHAYAFVDPVFFTLNDIGQQRSGQALDQFCVKCHSPLASLLGETPPGFDPAALSNLAKQGVQCDVCHTISTFEPGRSIAKFRLDGVKQGPIADPVPNSYHGVEFDPRYNKSAICSPCHDVFGPEGTQIEFTSTEWQTSPYTAMGLECQGCHMPTYSGQAAINGPQRDELHRHTFVGVDIPLVDFPSRDNTIAAVQELLQNSVTMDVSLPASVEAGGALAVKVSITNDRTGHNIPSGTIFERQMWIEVLVKDAATDAIIYQSGTLDENGDLLDVNSELVKSGAMTEDTDLTLFNGTPFKNGNKVPFFWEADHIENQSIPPFESRTAVYDIPGPFHSSLLDASVRLRFRSFPPYFLRAIGQEALVGSLMTFDMESHRQQVLVIN
ncbi:cytochrome c family protein [bacterium]|nr:cytochrome c family protein [bacterium]